MNRKKVFEKKKCKTRLFEMEIAVHQVIADVEIFFSLNS